MGGADENLADLQPEDSEEEDEMQEERPPLTSDQQVRHWRFDRGEGADQESVVQGSV